MCSPMSLAASAASRRRSAAMIAWWPSILCSAQPGTFGSCLRATNGVVSARNRTSSGDPALRLICRWNSWFASAAIRGVAVLGRDAHLPVEVLEHVDVLLREPPGRVLHEQLRDEGVHRIDVLDVARADLGDAEPAVELGDEQALPLEDRKRLAHGGRAHAQPVRERQQPERIAGWWAAGDDLVAQVRRELVAQLHTVRRHVPLLSHVRARPPGRALHRTDRGGKRTQSHVNGRFRRLGRFARSRRRARCPNMVRHERM